MWTRTTACRMQAKSVSYHPLKTTHLETSSPRLDNNVAVFYGDDFHIGSVVRIINPELAEVNLLRKCSLANPYVWPHKAEQEKTGVPFLHEIADFRENGVSKSAEKKPWGKPAATVTLPSPTSACWL